MKNQTTKQKTSISRSLYFLLALLFSVSLVSCDDDDAEPILPEPTIDKVEVGLNNNEIGVIGRDFHFNAEVLAGDKIDLVQLKIQQRAGETYSGTWSHDITWEQYKGAKNATIHKHFDIPAGAVEGKYDLLIVVTDENGTKLEEKRALTIYSPENLPADPQLFEFSVFARSTKNRVLYILTRGGYRDPVTQEYGDYRVAINGDETLDAAATISGTKGDGKLYVLLINKKLNHRPESIAAIDFSKAIVIDAYEHKDLVTAQDKWSHIDYNRPGFPVISRLAIGAANDNNSPNPNPITGLKAWESGEYYVGVIYQNTTYNMSLFHYMELQVNKN